MSDFIKALQIFMKYNNPTHPFSCDHDVLYVYGINPDAVSDSDIKLLEQLGFKVDIPNGCFYSFKYGSC